MRKKENGFPSRRKRTYISYLTNDFWQDQSYRMSNSIGFIKTDTFPTSRQAGEQESVACVLCQCMVGSLLVCVCLSISIFFDIQFGFSVHLTLCSHSFVRLIWFDAATVLSDLSFILGALFHQPFDQHVCFRLFSYSQCRFSFASCLSSIERFLRSPFLIRIFQSKNYALKQFGWLIRFDLGYIIFVHEWFRRCSFGSNPWWTLKLIFARKKWKDGLKSVHN